MPELTSITAGTATTSYTWAGGQTLLMTAGGASYGIAHDALGSTVALTSSTGAAVATASYGPFGTSLASTGTLTSPLGWESEYADPTTDLDQLDARDLNPGTGQFLSPDPVAAPVTEPAASPYLYADDQPTTSVDPAGQSALGVFANIVQGVGGAIPKYGTPIGDVLTIGQTAYDVGTSCIGHYSSVNCGQSLKRAVVAGAAVALTAGCIAAAGAAGAVTAGVGAFVVGAACGSVIGVASYLIDEHLFANQSSPADKRGGSAYGYGGVAK